MRRIFLRDALEQLLEQLGDDQVLLCDDNAWVTDRRPLRPGRLLSDVAAVARRVSIYAGARDGALAHLALADDLHLVAIGPPVRVAHTLIVHRGHRPFGVRRPPRVHYGASTPPLAKPLARPTGIIPVHFGGPVQPGLLPLHLQPPDDLFAEAVRITAAFATATVFRDVATSLPWTLIARHQQATVLAPASSPEHVLLAYGTDGQEPSLLLNSLDFTQEAPCLDAPVIGEPAALPRNDSCAPGSRPTRASL